MTGEKITARQGETELEIPAGDAGFFRSLGWEVPEPEAAVLAGEGQGAEAGVPPEQPPAVSLIDVPVFPEPEAAPAEPEVAPAESEVKPARAPRKR